MARVNLALTMSHQDQAQMRRNRTMPGRQSHEKAVRRSARAAFFLGDGGAIRRFAMRPKEAAPAWRLNQPGPSISSDARRRKRARPTQHPITSRGLDGGLFGTRLVNEKNGNESV
jgi:hypothetical protein